MKRILGIYSKNKKIDLSFFKHVIESVSHLKNPDKSEIFITDNLYLSAYSNDDDDPVFFKNEDNVFTYTGLIYFDKEPASKNEIEIKKYDHIKEFPANIDKIKGSYNIFKFNEKKDELYLYNNLLRGFPLYWFENDEIFIFCNDYEPLVKYGSNKYDINVEAIYDYLISKNTEISQTFFKNIHILAPGDRIIIKNNKLKLIKNKRKILISSSNDNIIKNANKYFETLKTEIHNIVKWNPDIPITITGGADTRMILGALSPDERKSSSFMTFSAKRDPKLDSSDIKIAIQLAKHYNLKHSIIEQKLYRMINVDHNYFKNIMNNRSIAITGLYGSETLRFHQFYEQVPELIRNTLDKKTIIQNIKEYNIQKDRIQKYIRIKSSKSYYRFRLQMLKTVKFLKNTDSSLPHTLMSLSHSFFSSYWNGASGNSLLPLSMNRFLITPYISEDVIKVLFSIPKKQLIAEEHGICNAIFKENLKELTKFESNSDLSEYENTVLKKPAKQINIPQNINYNNIEQALNNKYISGLNIFNLEKIKEDFIHSNKAKSYVWFDLILWLDYISSL